MVGKFRGTTWHWGCPIKVFYIVAPASASNKVCLLLNLVAVKTLSLEIEGEKNCSRHMQFSQDQPILPYCKNSIKVLSCHDCVAICGKGLKIPEVPSRSEKVCTGVCSSQRSRKYQKFKHFQIRQLDPPISPSVQMLQGQETKRQKAK